MADIPEEAEEERIFVVPIGPTRGGLRTQRAQHAIALIRSHVSRHMKAKPDKVWIDPHVNEALWKMGGEHVKPRMKVKAIKFEDGLVEVSLPK